MKQKSSGEKESYKVKKENQICRLGQESPENPDRAQDSDVIPEGDIRQECPKWLHLPLEDLGITKGWKRENEKPVSHQAEKQITM